jgi:hypothetical protein
MGATPLVALMGTRGATGRTVLSTESGLRGAAGASAAVPPNLSLTRLDWQDLISAKPLRHKKAAARIDDLIPAAACVAPAGRIVAVSETESQRVLVPRGADSVPSAALPGLRRHNSRRRSLPAAAALLGRAADTACTRVPSSSAGASSRTSGAVADCQLLPR